jgi:hypothetical protein
VGGIIKTKFSIYEVHENFSKILTFIGKEEKQFSESYLRPKASFLAHFFRVCVLFRIWGNAITEPVPVPSKLGCTAHYSAHEVLKKVLHTTVYVVKSFE